MNPDDRKRKQELLDTYKRSLHILQMQQAQKGLNVEPELIFSIEQAQSKIAEIERQLENPFPVPLGWVLVDQAFLTNYRDELSDDRVLSYFDGRVPQWEEALSRAAIPRRAIVGTLMKRLTAIRQKSMLGITLLTGAGGEGKSTAIRQVICDIVENESVWNVLWHEDPDTPLPREEILRLTRYKGWWLIASDDADLIARDVFEVVKALHKEKRKNFHFLLCCRDTDWRGVQADKLFAWNDFNVSFIKEELRGISQSDAELIVQAWSKYNEIGLGKLAGAEFSTRQAAIRLIEESKREKNDQEGAFLGALLRVRYGKELKNHVKKLLLRLEQRPAPGGTLLEAFAYITALHAENILLLSKEVLARALGCSPASIRPHVVGPLGAEAVVAAAGQLVLTRHSEIAKAAVELLSDEEEGFYFDFEEIYVRLVRSARELYHEQGSKIIPEPGKWAYLSDHFFKKDQLLGLRLAHEVLKLEPDNPYLIVHLSGLYRSAGQANKSVELFRSAKTEVNNYPNKRSFFYEWGTAEGMIGNHYVAAWLSGVSLADAETMYQPTNRDAVFSLNGLAVALGRLFDEDQDPVFIEACGAAAQLALKLRSLEGLSLREVRVGLAKSKEAGVPDMEPLVAIERLSAGIAAAWQQSRNDLQEWVRKGDELTFHGFIRLLHL